VRWGGLGSIQYIRGRRRSRDASVFGSGRGILHEKNQSQDSSQAVGRRGGRSMAAEPPTDRSWAGRLATCRLRHQSPSPQKDPPTLPSRKLAPTHAHSPCSRSESGWTRWIYDVTEKVPLFTHSGSCRSLVRLRLRLRPRPCPPVCALRALLRVRPRMIRSPACRCSELAASEKQKGETLQPSPNLPSAVRSRG
jgi:hypothetical protein